MNIIGAGMSGLLAGALNPGSTILEAGKEKESNHKAVFRCRKPDIGKMLGIPFKKVIVHKAIWFEDKEVNPSPRIIHLYSNKVTDKIMSRSIFNTASAIRYIPPKDFIHQLRKRCNIEYNTPIDSSNFYNLKQPIISTIPIFKNAEIFNLKLDMIYRFEPIYVNRMTVLGCDSQCTVYYPDPNFSAYRASIIGGDLIIEGMRPLLQADFFTIVNSLGIARCRVAEVLIKNFTQRFGKIIPIDNKIRQNLITNLTLKHGIYSLGRFATWRPKILLDDILNDIFVIRRLIEEGDYGSIKCK